MSKIGRGMLRARSLDEYKELLKEALYEIDEIRATAEFDDYMNDSVMIANSMEPELKALLDQAEKGSPGFGGDGMVFMQNMERIPYEIIPFKPLLTRINETVKKGLEQE